MKRIISLFLALSLILSVLYTLPTYADSVDSAIQARIDELYGLLGNTYFTTDQKSAGSSSSRCLNSNVIKADWFKEKFGISNLSVSQFPGSPRCTAEAWSCSGFASFAGWYIFKNSNTDNIRINKLSKMNYTYANVTSNAKIGDIVSLSGTKYNTSGVAVGTAGHEFIFISADSNGAYVLDSNWDNDCKVTKHYIRYSYCDYFQIGRATNRASVGPTDSEAPTISNLNTSNVSGSSFTINCNLNDNVGVTRVWLNVYGPGGSNGYSVSASNGSFSHTINTSDYGGAGVYSVHLYAFDNAGNSSVSNLSDINAVSDIESPVISNLHTTNVSSSSFTINCNLSDNVGVTRVWLNIYGPGGNNGYSVSASNGSFSHTINTSDYGGRGTYTVHVYAFDAAGNSISSAFNDIDAVTDSQAPVITLIRPTNVSSNSFTINGEMYDNVGVTRVWLNIYGPSGSNGYTIDTSNNSFSHTINTSDYGGSGYYSIHAYAWDAEGNSTSGTLSNFYVGNDYSAPIITNLNVSGISDSAFTINCSANEKIVRAWVYIMGPNKTEGYAVHLYGDSFMHTIETSEYGGAGSYEVHVYVWDPAGNESSGCSTGRFVANKRYTVNFNANQGVTPLSSMIVTNSSTYGTLPTPTRTGYNFNGWYTASSGGTQIVSSSTVWLSSAQTLYAHWTPNNYVAFLNANGGNVDKESINITYDSTYSSLPTPTRKGYYFNGWYTSSNGGSLVTNDTKVTSTSNQTLYAQWEELIPYTDSVVTKNGSNYYVNVVPVNIEDSCEIIVAAYKGGKFVTITSTLYNQIAISTTLSGDIDEIKIMAWDSLSALKSLCGAEVIPSSEFIVE